MDELPEEVFLMELAKLAKLCVALEVPARPSKQRSELNAADLVSAPPPIRYQKRVSSQISVGDARNLGSVQNTVQIKTT